MVAVNSLGGEQSNASNTKGLLAGLNLNDAVNDNSKAFIDTVLPALSEMLGQKITIGREQHGI